MLGAYIVFAAAVAVVTVYMLIVHNFLRSAEEPEDLKREARLAHETSHPSSHPHRRRTEYAH